MKIKIKNRFYIDCLEDEVFIGTENPTIYWNGFNCPTFDMETTRAILHRIKALGNGFNWEILTDEVRTTCDDHKGEWDTHLITDGQCSLGAFQWTWGSELSEQVFNMTLLEDTLSPVFDQALLKLRKLAGIVSVEDDTCGTFFTDTEWNRMDRRQRR